jgi:ADP-ribose pyrophosphatase
VIDRAKEQAIERERHRNKQVLPVDAALVFSGELFKVFQWRQELYDGTFATFERVQRPDSVFVLPVTEDGRLVLLEQEQPGRLPYMSLVGGRIEEGETALMAAQRELMEETGLVASDWFFLFSCSPYAKLEWTKTYLVALSTLRSAAPTLDAGERITTKVFEVAEAIQFLADGGIRDSELQLFAIKLSANSEMREAFLAGCIVK